MKQVSLTALSGIPMIESGDDVGALIVDAIRSNALTVDDQSIFVIAQKIISKAEGRAVHLDSVTPSDEATALAKSANKDARLVQLILNESQTIIRQSDSVIITENNLGIIMAHAGIDQSNIDENYALLLPEDPDASARAIAATISEALGVEPGVIVADSTGRPWRIGVIGIAIGLHGVPAVIDVRGADDLYGRKLAATQIGFSDGVAAAATLLMGQGSEGLPVVIVQQLEFRKSNNAYANELLRDADHDLFR